MSRSMRDQRGPRRGRAGCPPVLEIDLVHSDILGPAVEWPPAPPTRHTARRRAATQREPDVTELTTGRAIRLLDACVDHLRTALETNHGEDDAARIEDAIVDVVRVRESLAEIVDQEVIDLTDA